MTVGAHIFAPAGLSLTQDEIAFFMESSPWGFILFARNIEKPEQVKRLTDSLREAVRRDAPILVDQEGGRVQRMRGPNWREWEPPLVQVERDGTERGMYLRGRLIGAELAEIGVSANCAPSADIAYQDTHPFLSNRCYGRDVETVVAMARATANGLSASGILPVIKHAPGHGRATIDSHKAMPRISATLEDLNATDFEAFRALADMPMAMTGHVVVEALDIERPATQSSRTISYMRNELGLDQLLMTDDISMGALSGSIGERSSAALEAGCDVVLHCNGILSEMEEVAQASPVLEGQAKRRADAALAARKQADPIDIQAVVSELGDLLRESAYA